MLQQTPSQDTNWPAPPRRGIAVALAAGGALLIAAGALWIRYGTAVFFEMIASGIAACF